MGCLERDNCFLSNIDESRVPILSDSFESFIFWDENERKRTYIKKIEVEKIDSSLSKSLLFMHKF